MVYLLNKPVGVVTTNHDPAGRPRVIDLVPGEQRLFAVGRLDRMSEGLLLVTNDGPLANLLAHPRYGVEKRYLVQVAGIPTRETLDAVRRGVHLAEGQVHAKRIDVRSQHKQSTVLEMTLDEGKNREIRRMLAAHGHKVHQLKRVAVGGLTLGNLLPGQWRLLTWQEVDALRRDALRVIGPEAARPRPVGRQAGGSRVGRRPPRMADKRTVAAKREAAGRVSDDTRSGSDQRTARASRPSGGTRPGKARRPGKASAWRRQKSDSGAASER